ncbi:hypothetical protein [Klebsiella aerogenes]|uniref:hypothetical protein n=1 Tax=Klebsiella aerogenes TaxID=548 RepID=UPI000D342C28|nr:hypothetical protein [Klebsiella aerogenes]
MSKETLELARNYSNAHMVIERSVNLFHEVNQIRSSLADLHESMQPRDSVTDGELDNYDKTLRNLEKLLQKIERDAREEAIGIRYKIETQ